MSQSADSLFALLVEANPYPDASDLPGPTAEMPPLTVFDPRRGSMQTQTHAPSPERPHEPSSGSFRRWVPVFVGAALIVIAVIIGVLTTTDDVEPVSPIEDVTTTVAPSTDAGPEVPSDWDTYTDEASGFAVSYPGTWDAFITDVNAVPKLLSEVGDGAAAIEPANPLGAGLVLTEGEINPSLSVVVEALPRELTVNEYVADRQRALAELIPSYEVTEEIETVVGDRDAVVVFSTHLLSESDPTKDGRVWSVELVTTDGRTGWTSTCVAEVAFDGSAPTPDLDELENVVRTFEFLN